VYNPELFVSILNECLRIAELFGDTLLVTALGSSLSTADSNATSINDHDTSAEDGHNYRLKHFNRRFCLELLTCFGLFDYFDHRHLLEDNAAVARSFTRLRDLNLKLFKHLEPNWQPKMIDYHLALLNMDMAFEAVNARFFATASSIVSMVDFDQEALRIFANTTKVV
jgi:hypothetical protein